MIIKHWSWNIINWGWSSYNWRYFFTIFLWSFCCYFKLSLSPMNFSFILNFNLVINIKLLFILKIIVTWLLLKTAFSIVLCQNNYIFVVNSWWRPIFIIEFLLNWFHYSDSLKIRGKHLFFFSIVSFIG